MHETTVFFPVDNFKSLIDDAFTLLRMPENAATVVFQNKSHYSGSSFSISHGTSLLFSDDSIVKHPGNTLESVINSFHSKVSCIDPVQLDGLAYRNAFPARPPLTLISRPNTNLYF
jgi:hypothetical protein